MNSLLSKVRQNMQVRAGVGKNNTPIQPGAFVFCERSSGAIRFQVEAAPNGCLPVEQAASLLAMHCLVRGQTPSDYAVQVVPRKSLLDPVEQRAEELLSAWRQSGNEVELSPRKHEVLAGVLRNLSNKEIGQKLNITERTVKFHVSALLAKFNVPDRVSLMRQATIGMVPAAAAPPNTLFGMELAAGK
jgi:DNA-binding CsgD family transcriptional regulator